MKTFETFLPVFPGFYGTLFEPNEEPEIEYINEKRIENGLPILTDIDLIQFDYEAYRKRTAIRACSYIERELKALEINCNIEFQEVFSPRFYNYSNDSVNIKIELDFSALKKYLIDNKEALKDHFKDCYTSCDGFISFYSPDINDWIDYLDTKQDDNHIIGAILNAILLTDNENSTEDMYYFCVDNMFIEALNFDELTTEKEAVK